MTLKSVTNPKRKNSRVAVVISKKVLKSAVGRNRIRRRVYEIIRHELASVHAAHDLAFIVTSAEARDVEAVELHKTISQLLLKSGVYRKPL